MTQGQLARLIAVDQGTVSKWENGAGVDRSHYRALAEFFGVKPGDVGRWIAEEDDEGDEWVSVEDVRDLRERLARLEAVVARLDGTGQGES